MKNGMPTGFQFRLGDLVEIIEVPGFNYREPGLPGDQARIIKPFTNMRSSRPGWVIQLEIDETTFWADACVLRILPQPTQIVLDWRALRGIWQPPSIL